MNAGATTNRRAFLAASAAGAVALALPGAAARLADEPRILALELLTAAPLAAMKKFYQETLGLRVTDERDDRLTIAGGATAITFVRSTKEPTDPFYHFAFNIPQNKIRAAHAWQTKRTALLPVPPALRDAAYPDDVVHFAHWNAHAIYFFDPAQNVVEYIARHDLANDAPADDFGSDDILYASEIAFVTDDVAATTDELKDVARVAQYRGASDEFAAVGDERGLLLVMKRGRVISFDSPTKKAVDVFRTSARAGARGATHRLTGYPYELTTTR